VEKKSARLRSTVEAKRDGSGTLSSPRSTKWNSSMLQMSIAWTRACAPEDSAARPRPETELFKSTVKRRQPRKCLKATSFLSTPTAQTACLVRGSVERQPPEASEDWARDSTLYFVVPSGLAVGAKLHKQSRARRKEEARMAYSRPRPLATSLEDVARSLSLGLMMTPGLLIAEQEEEARSLHV
jgi:hypothetical protein